MKRFNTLIIAGALSVGTCGPIRAGSTAYVATNGAHVFPYDTWATAASNLQAAVDAVDTGGTVWASNGVYAAGGAMVYGMSNRVVLTRAVTLQSVNGPDVTFIKGQGPLGAGAVRCAYLTNGTVLAGFTLTNGFTRKAGDSYRELSGGGAWLDRGGAVSNCTVSGCSSSAEGGGVFCFYGGAAQACTVSGNRANDGGGFYFYYGGTAQSCTARGNVATTLGGGAECCGGGTMRNCAISGNSAPNGGGIRCSYSGSTVLSCTIGGNSATTQGGGVFCASGGILVNTVVFANTGCSSSNVYVSGTGMSFTNCCAAPAVSGTGNITADPKFVNAAAGDYRLQASSPCIDTGLNLVWMDGATDLDGMPRVLNGTVDIGAHEADYRVITVTPGTTGAVSPSGTVRVLRGQPLTVTFAPDADYYAADALVDGQSLGAMTGYTFENVTNDHSVSVTFLPSPAVTYASTNGASLYPYDTWEKAAAVLQDAANVVHSGGTVWVSNGVFATGGATVYGMSNRVALTRAVTLQSVNGAEVTFIKGQGPLGAGAVRCAYLTNGAALVGFTLTNGFTRVAGERYRELSGGGAWLDRGGTVSNCTVCGNTVSVNGGGIFFNYGGTALNCAVVGNTTSGDGGGLFCNYGGTARSCAISGNTVTYNGGGIFCERGGTVQNCTVSGNKASDHGGGVKCMYGGALLNTVVFPNTGCSSSNVYAEGTGMSFTNCCAAPAVSGTGNITADPKFVNAAAGDYRLRAGSPCIDTGTNQTWMVGATDLDGKPRVLNGTADIGAYESGFTVTASAGPNGSVSPSGTVFVAKGQSLTVTVTPDADCYVADVIVDGQSMGASAAPVLSYTFSDEASCHTLAATFLARPAVTFVSTNGASLYPYDTWEKAATVIQNAADYVRTGGTVWVTNGVYAAGSATVYGMSNRVALTRPVALQSVNGPEVTVIRGQGPLGAGAIRCAYLTNGATLVGFTLTNGFTRTAGDLYRERSGGGAWLDRGGTVSNCTVSGNTADYFGGGVFCSYGGTVLNCVLSGNSVCVNGGGVFNYQGGTVRNCTVCGNSANDGAGLYCSYGGAVQNCTVSGNSARFYGGGVCCLNGGTVVNTISFGNTACDSSYNIGAYGEDISFTACCTDTGLEGEDNIAADPKFVNAAAGDYGLQTDSPCVDAGLNEVWMDGATDLDGKPRVLGEAVDIGTYETGFPISATAGPHGAISPGGTVWVAPGGTQTFAIIPDPTYHVEKVTVDGVSVGAPACYTFADVTNSHTLAVEFSNAFTVSATAGTHGRVSPTGTVTVTYGASATFTFLPDATYHVAEVTADGVSAGSPASYTFTNITNNHALAVEFSNTFTITATTGAHGNVSPAGTTTVTYGDSVTCSFSPDISYHVSKVMVDGVSVGSPTSYTFTGVTANHNLTVEFSNTFTVTATAGAHGSVSPAGATTVTYGESLTLSISPDACYHVSDIKVDGVSIAATNTVSFLGVTNNHTLAATFALDFLATVYVSTSGSQTFPYTNWTTAARNIQVAIDAAASPGTLVLVASGEYNTGGTVIKGANNRVALTKAVTVRSVSGPNATTIRGQGTLGTANAMRCAYLTNGAVLAGFKLVNGVTCNGSATNVTCGGGAWLDDLGTLSNCIINGNSAYNSGGGVFLNAGSKVSDCIINGNSAYNSGGGAFLNYFGFITNCILSNNSAGTNLASMAGGRGGGVFSSFSGRITDCTIISNSANSGFTECGQGGGVFFDGFGQRILNKCVVRGNYARGATLSNSSLTAYGGSGGGVYCGTYATLQNCSIGGNYAEGGYNLRVYYMFGIPQYDYGPATGGKGGGVYVRRGSLQNCTLANNCSANIRSGNQSEEGKGGGIYVNEGSLCSCIVFSNTAATGANWHEYAAMNCTYSCVLPGRSGTGNIAADPLFVNAAAGDFRLQTVSPCLDTGINEDWMAGATDLDGKPRVIHGTVDIGAYEAILPGWDEDADGLPDEWEWGKARTLTGLAPDADADGDGADNLAEYRADTDPFSGASLLALTGIAPEPGGMRVAWRGGRDAWQFLERSTNLSAGAEGWTAVYTNAPPTALSAEASDLTPAGDKAFYRVRAQR